ncbi:MFS transporter [Serratia fonticola]|uniref:MFS transporter n=1 Tax=Serratia fonticola TaxID=47917 RepID=UPI00217781F4|nr:MFS transporter [Serratia fonticola]CAI1602213.1 Inner membrane transport protein ynfM [Serratia fonticola]HBE9180748.1 MFS transporter [Serratia fonticola]
MDIIEKKFFIILLPVICGFISANMYYVQPLIPFIQQDLQVTYEKASMLYSLSLLGNALSLVFIIPLGDFFSKKKLIETLLIVSIVSLGIFYYSRSVICLKTMAVVIGIGTSVIPLIIASLSSFGDKGINSIGRIMAGVMIGILFSRFISGIMSALWGWKTIYLFSTIIMTLSYFFIHFLYPEPTPNIRRQKYIDIIKSNGVVFFTNPDIRNYSLSGFFIMCIFSSYWTNVSSYLTDKINYDQFSIGIFSLTGVAGASAAMFSNSLLRKLNNNNRIILWFMTVIFALLLLSPDTITFIITGALLIDAFIQLVHINNQKMLFSSCPGSESRAASCYMTSFVIGGAIGGTVSSYLYSYFNWSGVLVFCLTASLICVSLTIRKS